MRKASFLHGLLIAGCLGLSHAGATAAENASPTPDPSAPALLWMVTLRPATPALYDVSKWSPQQQAAGAAHGAYLQHLHQAGVIAFGGRAFDFSDTGLLTSDSFALVIVRARDRAAANALFAADPGVRDGLLRTTVTSFDQAFPP